MSEKIEVGVVVKGAGKAASDINKVGKASKNLGGDLKGNNFIVDQLTGSLDQMTGGAFSGFKKAAGGLKTFITGLKTTKTAIIATGIGALVVAFGLLVTYWDDIKVLVNGVTSEQKNLLIYAEATRDATQDQLDITHQSQASLRLAGKSEREILNLKTQQTNEVILATEAILIQQQEVKKTQVAASLRNQKIMAGFLALMNLPLTMMLGSIDLLTYGLAKLGLMEKATNLVEDANMYQASFIFDPAKVEEEGDAVIEETENQLRKLRNTRDGFVLQQQAADAAAEQARVDAEAERKAAEDARKQIKADEDTEAMNEFFANLEAIAKAEEDATIKRLKQLKIIKDAEEATAKAVRAARLGVVAAGFAALKSMAKTEAGQRKLAVAQILVNQGVAMSNAVAAGLSAAAKMPQPAGLFAAPGFVATALGIALSSFASIKGVMNQAGASAEGIGSGGGGGTGGGGGGVGIASNREQPTLGLTPDISENITSGSIPPINAYVVQSQLADQNALAAQIESAASL